MNEEHSNKSRIQINMHTCRRRVFAEGQPANAPRRSTAPQHTARFATVRHDKPDGMRLFGTGTGLVLYCM